MLQHCAALAQLVEHGIRNAGVVSSSLTGGTIPLILNQRVQGSSPCAPTNLFKSLAGLQLILFGI